ncbi:glycoside hydrolase, partial [Mrakia frigida]|uniref:mannosyl-oligosaccharide glucosidase n=1 Tax=Mrakia frigida TaxID=29902 RepID=UPI003FCC1046
LLWSTYAPQLYFGIKPRLPKSLTSGLLWFGLNDWEGLQRIHHTTSSSPPHESGLESYTYTSHIPRVGNTQRLLDSRNKLRVDTSFVNLNDGKDWGARVEMNGEEDTRMSGIWYISLEGEGGLRLVEQEDEEEGLTSPIVLLGNTPDLGSFRIVLTEHADANPITTGHKANLFSPSHGKVSYAGASVPESDLWRAKDIVATLLSNKAQSLANQFSTSTPANSQDLPDPAFVLGRSLGNQREAFQSNFWAFQFSSQGKGGWDVSMVLILPSPVLSFRPLSAPAISNSLSTLLSLFSTHFSSHLPIPPTSPYSSPSHLAFAQEVTSNLLGGIGYFHGRSLIDRSFAHEYDDTPELEEGEVGGVQEMEERGLLTATPSRSFFPRGFYWDEGFHLLVVGEWDNDLSLEILKSWVDLIDEDGWVGREQILGEEARSKVPSEFQVQYPTNANPPTLTMAVTSFISRLKAVESSNLLSAQLGLPPSFPANSKYLSSPTEARSYLLSIYPALRRHYLWFRRTQKGQLKEWGRKPPSRMESYRWRGRTEHHVLTSGLDDYPRALPPHVGELHVDLMCWMGFFARTMGEIAEYLGEEVEDDLEEYRRNEGNVVKNIEALHWSEEDQMYCDATVDDDDESTFVCHAGYISLFPFLTGLLPPSSPHLGPVLDLMRDPEKLWSDYGIRSLSKDHPLFGQGENYWRGPIWMPFNYMALSSLYKIYMPHPGPHQARAKEIYTELRANLIENIFKEYQSTGYVWEQYDALTGEGSRSHPFTGWTSLVAMSE